jgi:hypothetical protein
MVPYLMGQKRMASILSFISLIRLSLVTCSVFAHFHGICALIKRRANQQVQASNLPGFEIASYMDTACVLEFLLGSLSVVDAEHCSQFTPTAKISCAGHECRSL